MKKLTAVVLFVFASSFAMLGQADNHATLRVVTVETDNVQAYVEELEKGKAIMAQVDKRMLLRAWVATFAGDQTGTVIVSLEYPGSFADFAGAWQRITENEAMAAWLSGLSEVRALVSDSLYRELSI